MELLQKVFGIHELDIVYNEDGEGIDSRIYDRLEEMFNQMESGGLYPEITEGYRSYSEQQDILDRKIIYYMLRGRPRIIA